MRSTAALEQLAGVKKFFFDKTGTLTKLPMQVSGIFSSVDEKEFLRVVASAESASEHPLAQAIVNAAKKRRFKLARPAEFKALPGLGLISNFDEKRIVIGSARLMSAEGLKMSARIKKQAEAWKDAGQVVVYAGWGGRVVGLIGLGETVRDEASHTINELKSRGFEMGVLTGDDLVAGKRWQKILDIPVRAALSPNEKMTHLAGGAAMVGDGINDGPALAAAKVGIAMRNGTDVAGAAADVILLRDDLRALPWLVDLSRAAMQRVRENLGWAFIYNVIGIGLAMAGLMQPVLAALAMVMSSIFVTANAMRMKNFETLK